MCDAAENMTMKDDPEVKTPGIKFEIIGPRTPQKNGKVERNFQTLYGRIQSMIMELGYKVIWAKCVMTATYLLNVITTKSSLKIPFEVLDGVNQVNSTKDYVWLSAKC
jgi:hypothetical protein